MATEENVGSVQSKKNTKKKNSVENEQWYKERFPTIKTIQRETAYRPNPETKEKTSSGIFTTVVLHTGEVGIVKLQPDTDDNIELGVLWAYTKASEKSEKSDKAREKGTYEYATGYDNGYFNGSKVTVSAIEDVIDAIDSIVSSDNQKDQNDDSFDVDGVISLINDISTKLFQ